MTTSKSTKASRTAALVKRLKHRHAAQREAQRPGLTASIWKRRRREEGHQEGA